MIRNKYLIHRKGRAHHSLPWSTLEAGRKSNMMNQWLAAMCQRKGEVRSWQKARTRMLNKTHQSPHKKAPNPFLAFLREHLNKSRTRDMFHDHILDPSEKEFYRGQDYFFCPQCDEYNAAVASGTATRIKRDSIRFCCRAGHKSAIHPTEKATPHCHLIGDLKRRYDGGMESISNKRKRRDKIRTDEDEVHRF